MGRATETVQHCKEYIVSAKDASLQQVNSVLAKAGKEGDATSVSPPPDMTEEEVEKKDLVSIDQAVENIERNRMASFPFAGFPADSDENEEDPSSVSGGQVATT